MSGASGLIQKDVAAVRDLRGVFVVQGDPEKIARLTVWPRGWLLWALVLFAVLQLTVAGASFSHSQWLRGCIAMASPVVLPLAVFYGSIGAFETSLSNRRRRAGRSEIARWAPSRVVDIRWLELLSLIFAGLAFWDLFLLVTGRC